jgi:hypothetical protein
MIRFDKCFENGIYMKTDEAEQFKCKIEQPDSLIIKSYKIENTDDHAKNRTKKIEHKY